MCTAQGTTAALLDLSHTSCPLPAVTVHNAYKKYANVVLQGLNMTVPEGTIYGLLGPSGCGKTTLLSCIVGRSELDSGEIYVKAKKKSNIGYMPQELALYMEFSIYETLAYYGRLFGMSTKKIKKQTEELIDFLDLPPHYCTVNNLSGGQQRRVSFAVALLHDPQLLILDEPTVGVDPVLSHSIWQHLLQMSTSGKKTIVITTHYIEEARQAHTIGLMREGVLLAEESPSQLMLAHNCTTLEQAFLELSQKQLSSATHSNDDSTNYPSPLKPPSSPLENGIEVRGCRILAQLTKTVYWMKRNVPIMGFLLMLPVVQCVLFNLAIGNDPKGLYVAVVDKELQNGLKDCYSIPKTGCNIHLPLSCRYLETLKKKTIKMIEFDDLEEAKEAVRRNDAWGVMYFADNYTDTLIERINFTSRATNLSLELSEVSIWMDMSNQYIGNLMKRDMLFGFIAFLRHVFEDCGWPPQVADIPIDFQRAVYGNNNPSFVHFTAPAIIGFEIFNTFGYFTTFQQTDGLKYFTVLWFEFYLPMMFTVGAILMEKMAGILERSLVAGITVLEVIISHIIVQFILLSIQTVLMMVVLFVIFDNPLIGSLSLTLSLLLLIGICGTCYGFMVSVICDSETAATFMGLGSFFPLAMLSGMMWPMEGMHYILRSIGWILPLTLSTEAFRAISARDWSLSHPAVYRGFISCICWIGYFLFITYIVVKLRKGIRGR